MNYPDPIVELMQDVSQLKKDVKALQEENAFLRQTLFEVVSTVGAHPDFYGAICDVVKKWPAFKD